jgi:cobalamin biosynthesis Mg chelatase CobN
MRPLRLLLLVVLLLVAVDAFVPSRLHNALGDFSSSLRAPGSVLKSTETQEVVPGSLASIPTQSEPPGTPKRNGIVIVAGFEQFNILLYRKAAEIVMQTAPDVPISVFTDQDIEDNPLEVQEALYSAQILFCSLIFDFKQVQWLLDRLEKVPTRFCFESSLELMSETRVNSFEMKGGGEAPAPVKALLKKFGSDKEEDKLQGYLKFLKVGPKLLKWVPVSDGKIADLRNWLTVYAYWTEGGLDNVVNMLFQIIQEPSLGITTAATSNGEIDYHHDCEKKDKKKVRLQLSKPIVEYPAVGLYHHMQVAQAAADPTGETPAFFDTPAQYLEWYYDAHPGVSLEAPRVAVLLYRKHVLTEQAYIPNLLTLMETEGIVPVPVFINGVEAHTVVRDLLTSPYEPVSSAPSLVQAASVDAIVNTIGFPLVGGPAGSMEGGRGIELAKEILCAKNVPYFVAAPLLIQDMDSWAQGGVQGLQQVVLYSLPELDGAIETVVLGGLVGGDSITIIPERVRKLLARVKSKVALRKKEASERTLSFICYGFPPSVGAVGTAALLNVEKSLENVLLALHGAGYDLGPVAPSLLSLNDNDDNKKGNKKKRLGGGAASGADIVGALKLLSRDDITAGGASRAQEMLEQAGFRGLKVVGKAVTHTELRGWLGKKMTQRMESQWGDLSSYADIACAGQGKFSVLGLQLGKVFIGVQPVLGIEGDPMRLLFERDLTPHPQYAAFYKWLSEEMKPDCYVHFGMHGTVEWLPGSPLGNTAESWSDVLLGSATNVYVYACNNPSESILAKRRGYATIVSHNVPPYCRSGLYKELLSLKDALAEYKEDELSWRRSSDGGGSGGEEREGDRATALLAPLSVVAALVRKAGLERDLPFPSVQHPASPSPPLSGEGGEGYCLPASFEDLEAIVQSPRAGESASFLDTFSGYATALGEYLRTLENRLFSEGLHVLGEPVGQEGLLGYLDALYGTQSVPATSTTSPAAVTRATRSIAASASLGKDSNAGSASAAQSGSATDRNSLESRSALARSTLETIAAGAVSIAPLSSPFSTGGAGESALFFKAIRAQKDSERGQTQAQHQGQQGLAGAGAGLLEKLGVEDATRAEWEMNGAFSARSGYGVNWAEALTDEDKFALSLLRAGDLSTFVSLQVLQWQRGWGVDGSEEKIQDLVVAGSSSRRSTSSLSSSSSKRREQEGSLSNIREAVKVARLLASNPHTELRSLVSAIGGSYVPPCPGGDLIRDGPGVLPTGSNIHSLDPYRIPSNTALRRGQVAAEKILAAHRKQNGGEYPETVAVTLWGLDVIKTKGESIGIVLGLLGAVPVREATGRIVSFDLIPIKELGRPRIDVVASLSGIFRDTFSNVLALLDELFEKASDEQLSNDDLSVLRAAVPGQGEFNYVKKHTSSMAQAGIERPTSRMFSQPPGDFGSMVNEQVGSGEWSDSSELGNQWESRNGFSYGSGKEAGKARPEVLKSLLSTTERVVQEVDSVEYGLTDIQEYYANTGGLKKAAENNSVKGPGAKVGISIIEAFQADVEPKELEETLRMEYRTKLLNPAWANAMRKQGSGGAYEVSTRMTALIGWGGTYSVLLLFLLFILFDVSVSLLSIYCCLPEFSDTTWHESNHHFHPSINYRSTQYSHYLLQHRYL